MIELNKNAEEKVMARSFKELEAKMNPESRARAASLVQKTLLEMHMKLLVKVSRREDRIARLKKPNLGAA